MILTFEQFVLEAEKTWGDAWSKSKAHPKVRKAAQDFKHNAFWTVGKPVVGALTMGSIPAMIPGAHKAIPIMAAAGAGVAGLVGTVQGYPLRTATAATRYIAHRAIQTIKNRPR